MPHPPNTMNTYSPHTHTHTHKYIHRYKHTSVQIDTHRHTLMYTKTHRHPQVYTNTPSALGNPDRPHFKGGKEAEADTGVRRAMGTEDALGSPHGPQAKPKACLQPLWRTSSTSFLCSFTVPETPVKQGSLPSTPGHLFENNFTVFRFLLQRQVCN